MSSSGLLSVGMVMMTNSSEVTLLNLFVLDSWIRSTSV